MREEVLPKALADQRLDRVVSIIADVSRAVAAALIEGSAVNVDGELATSGKVKVLTAASSELGCCAVPATIDVIALTPAKKAHQTR